MRLVNARYFDGDFVLREGQIQVEEGNIVSFDPPTEHEAQTYDMQGCIVLPGLIDVHIHGCGGAQLSDASPAAIAKMARFLAKEGITSLCRRPSASQEKRCSHRWQPLGIRGARAGRTSSASIWRAPFFPLKNRGFSPKRTCSSGL